MIHYSLDYLEYMFFWEDDTITKEFGPKITKDNADNLHGINYHNILLKPRSYNRTVMQFIDRVLEPTDKFDYRTACEVNTRIYVRNDEGKWKSVPKRKFWKEQCRLLWNLWKTFVNYARPKIKDWDNCLEVARKQWSDRLMHQIDARRKDGEFRYNPLLSVKSRQRLREIYKKHVFNRELYDKEKGKPGRPKKIIKKIKVQPVQSAVDRSVTATSNQTTTSQTLII